MSRHACAWSILLSLLVTTTVVANDFRIDTKVYVDDEATPRYETITLFQRGVVYDFLGGSGGEVTIYDPRVRKFTLLDTEREIKTEISDEVLLQFVAEVKLRASERGGPTVREAADPNFKTLYDDQSRQLSLSGRRLDYIATAGNIRFPSAQAGRDYFEFIDNYTRLNATRVGAMPPQARLELNRALAEHDMFPAKIKRVMRSGNALLGKETIARSEHTISWRLVRRDQDLIDLASKHRANFTPVSFGEYRELGPAPQPAPRIPGTSP